MQGKTPSYRVHVQQDGRLSISYGYLQRMKAQPGDEFKVTLGDDYIHLQKIPNNTED